MMRFRNDGSQSPPVVAHTISANGWVIAPATRLILSLLISPVGSRMPNLTKSQYEDVREEIKSSAKPLYFNRFCQKW